MSITANFVAAEDTRRVSAVEGTKIDFSLQLNKPVKTARLVARDGKKTAIPLVVSPDKAVASLPAFVPAKRATCSTRPMPTIWLASIR